MDDPMPFYSNIYSGQTYTQGQGIISLRFDDGVAKDFSQTYPLLTARSLVAGFSVIRNNLNGTGNLTLAQCLTMQTAGMEIQCHSRTHAADPASFALFKDESLKAASEMWLIGLKAVSFVQPGTWVADYNINDPGNTDATLDAFLRSRFAAYEAYGQVFDAGTTDTDHRCNLPRSTKYAVNHCTGDSLTEAQLEALVGLCETGGQGTEILFHSNNIGQASYITLADFTTFLTFLQTEVTAGRIKVMTPTQQLFAAAA